MSSAQDSFEKLKAGSIQITSEAELRQKLAGGRPLRVKLGVDPTAPDLHLEHSLPLLKLRQFQDFGHTAVLIIGDFTSMVGDPSGRSSTRPILTPEQVKANAETYRTQAFKILDENRTEVVFNSQWFSKMNFMDIIRLNSRVTLQQMLQREDFKQRLEQRAPVFLHEIQYPLMQGWDSVMVRSDVELGATDQLFNILVGRDLQKQENQSPQVAYLLPVLEGIDGVQKMSKSLGNYIGLQEEPSEMFGKLMSISDSLMKRYYALLLNEQLESENPLEAKKQLAFRIVEQYHGRISAQRAAENFDLRFAKRDLAAAALPEISIAHLGPDLVSLVVQAYRLGFQITRSRTEARRLIEQGSIQWRGEKVIDLKATLPLQPGEVIRLDKTRAVRLQA